MCSIVIVSDSKTKKMRRKKKFFQSLGAFGALKQIFDDFDRPGNKTFILIINNFCVCSFFFLAYFFFFFGFSVFIKKIHVRRIISHHWIYKNDI